MVEAVPMVIQCPGLRNHLTLQLSPVLLLNPPSTQFHFVASTVCARTQHLTAPVGTQLRTAGE